MSFVPCVKCGEPSISPSLVLEGRQGLCRKHSEEEFKELYGVIVKTEKRKYNGTIMQKDTYSKGQLCFSGSCDKCGWYPCDCVTINHGFDPELVWKLGRRCK